MKIRENEAREPFRGGRHPYWYPGETECCYILVNCRKDLGTAFKICQGKRRGGGGGGGGGAIQIAAKLLLANINTETSKEYASGAKVADLAANLDYIPPSL